MSSNGGQAPKEAENKYVEYIINGKNADGAQVDTPEQSKAALCELHRGWLESAGATVLPGVKVEIHPAWALDAGEVRKKVESDCKISCDTFLR